MRDNERVSSDTAPVTSSTSAERMRRYRQRERELMYTREDWHLFLDRSTLPQKAGCHAIDLPKIILKEVTDNGLDNQAVVTLSQSDGTWIIDDDGPGLSPPEIQRLFAVNRPLLSNKLKRLPLRGMLGNGLRVVMGGVTAFGGSIAVESRGRRLTLSVDKVTGKTIIEKEEPSDKDHGLRIHLNLNNASFAQDAEYLAEQSIAIATHGEPYNGPSNPWWYGPADLERLFQYVTPASATVGAVCHDLRLHYVDERPARTLPREEIETVLAGLRGNTAQIDPKELGPIGSELVSQWAGYAMKTGITITQSGAHLPYLVEAWATCARPEIKGQGDCTVGLIVNRSMTMATLYSASFPHMLQIQGCGIHRQINGPQTGDYVIVVSVISPYVQLATDGKEPELKPFGEAIGYAVGKACGQAHRAMDVPDKAMTIKDAGYQVMAKAYAAASGNYKLAHARQVMYAARPAVLRLTGLKGFGDGYFIQTVIRGYLVDHREETANWDIVFDARGYFTEPHTGHSVPLGTIDVRAYVTAKVEISAAVQLEDWTLYPTIGPKYRFNSVVFIEKEGFDVLWDAAQISERYDIGRMSTKGLSVEAARKLVDYFCGCGVRIFVLRDFDISGFKIFGTLGTDNEKVYTFENKVEPIDLGLRLVDARRLHLQDEPVEITGDWHAHSATLVKHGATAEEVEFLKGEIDTDGKRKGMRVELNMMTMDVFVSFLEDKFEEHGIKKIVPKPEILEAHARRVIERDLAAKVISEALPEIQRNAKAAKLPLDLEKRVRALLAKSPALSWDAAVTQLIRKQTS